MKHKVICVDDQVGIRMLLKEILKEDYSVKTVGTGEEAIRVSKDFKPDVIVVDMHLEDMNGTDVLDKLKSIDSDIKAIMITGYEEEFIFKQLKSVKPEFILKKPFDIVSMQKKLSYLTKESHLESACV